MRSLFSSMDAASTFIFQSARQPAYADAGGGMADVGHPEQGAPTSEHQQHTMTMTASQEQGTEDLDCSWPLSGAFGEAGAVGQGYCQMGRACPRCMGSPSAQRGPIMVRLTLPKPLPLPSAEPPFLQCGQQDNATASWRRDLTTGEPLEVQGLSWSPRDLLSAAWLLDMR